MDEKRRAAPMTPGTGAARALLAETAADPTGPSPPAGLSVDCQRPARQRGFTLIELMISVLIVAILAMLGATAYEGAVMRARIAEGMNLVAPLKTLIHENLAVDRTANACSGVTDLTTPVGSVVSAVCTDDGSVATVRLTLTSLPATW